jgi:biopolymer transport protein ExbB
VESAIQHVAELLSQAVEIWLAGGWAMSAIAIVALVMFGLGVSLHLRLWGLGFRSVRERTWRRWLDEPAQRRGPIGELIEFVTGGATLADRAVSFEEVRKTAVAPFERDLKVMKVCVGAAPLFGLLGTVTGMLATFAALSTGSGGEKTMTQVADGISEALITTETGLVVALAGLFFQYQLTRTHERYKAFLAHLETVCAQNVYRTSQDSEQRERRVAAVST